MKKSPEVFKKYLDEGVITKDDFWTMPVQQGGAVIISHDGVQKIANYEKIVLKNFEVLIQPNVSNNQQHLMKIIIAKGKEKTIQVGEASEDNTTSVSAKYKGAMAFKRGFDRAVLDCIKAFGAYAETESDEFSRDYAKAKPFIDEIERADKKSDLTKVADKIKNTKGLSRKMIDLLREAYSKRENILKKK